MPASDQIPLANEIFKWLQINTLHVYLLSILGYAS